MDNNTGNREYEPKNYGEIIDLSLRLFVKNFRDYAYITYAVFIPLTAVMGIVFTIAPAIIDDKDPIRLSLFLLITGLFSSAITVIFISAAIKYTSETYLGNSINCREAFIYSLKTYSPMTLTLMLVTAIIGIPGVLTVLLLIYGSSVTGYVFSVVLSSILLFGGMYGFYSFTLVPYVLIIENKTGMNSLRRSFELFRSGKDASSKVVLMPLLINSLTSIMTMFASFIPVIGILLIYLSLPVTVITMTLVYYDIRMRYEGLDLLLTAENMEKQEIHENSPNLSIYSYTGEGISAGS